MARKLTLEFLRTEAASGAILGLAALLALVLANSPWADAYFGLLNADIPLRIAGWSVTETVAEWIKEGLMAVFFFVVGLEIKYEILRGELSNPRKLALPVIAAIGGMVVPAAIYLGVAGAMGGNLHGWSVPVATDIAFALAAFAVVGRGLPATLRVFLLTLAIVDDLGAVAIIAVFYSHGMNLAAVAGAGVVLAILAVLGRRVRAAAFWIAGFLLVWGFTMEAHVSTSLAGVAVALTVPIDPRRPGEEGQLKNFIQTLHPYVAYLILPVFAFSAAGFSFAGLGLERLASPIALGIAAGLFLGKQVGVFGAARLAIAAGVGARPSGAAWRELYGVSLLCGVGFTMSLFIGALAFPAGDPVAEVDVKLGVVAGSVLSALVGMIVLWRESSRRRDAEQVAAPVGPGGNLS